MGPILTSCVTTNWTPGIHKIWVPDARLARPTLLILRRSPCTNILTSVARVAMPFWGDEGHIAPYLLRALSFLSVRLTEYMVAFTTVPPSQQQTSGGAHSEALEPSQKAHRMNRIEILDTCLCMAEGTSHCISSLSGARHRLGYGAGPTSFMKAGAGSRLDYNWTVTTTGSFLPIEPHLTSLSKL
jgi:hypothetical protein